MCIIPARGGSKGVPGKNLKLVGGQSLVFRACRTALASRCDLVVVSTDDHRIATQAWAAGALAVGREPETATDEASSESCLLDALSRIDAGQFRGLTSSHPHPLAGFDALVMLQCTAPFTEPEDIDGCLELVGQNWDTAFAAARFHGFLWRAEAKDAVGVDHCPAMRPRRQELAARPTFLEAGSVYAMRLPGFLRYRHRFFGRIAFHEIPPERCFEIDSEADLLDARCLATARTTAGTAPAERTDQG